MDRLQEAHRVDELSSAKMLDAPARRGREAPIEVPMRAAQRP
jgi:hypothetical protein